MFTLPKVSARLKLKLTALEGSRVRRVSAARFGSCRAEDYGEHHLAVLTNLGDVQVVSLPLLKPQVRYSCIRREDVSGIASCVFTKYGQGVRGAGSAGPLPPWAGFGLPLHRGCCWEGQRGVFRQPGSVENFLRLWFLMTPKVGVRGGECSAVGSHRASSGCPHLPAFSTPPPGFYLISPSEFERFSLSTKWLVEPRCLVDSAESKNRSRPGNGSGPEKFLGRARWVEGQVAFAPATPRPPFPGVPARAAQSPFPPKLSQHPHPPFPSQNVEPRGP